MPAKSNVQELGRIAAEQDNNYRIKRAEAIALAKKNGWEIEKTYKDGRHVSLQGLDAKGMPLYYITYNNSYAAATTSTNQLWAGGALGLNLSGASSAVSDKLGIWDGGKVRDTHVELSGRVQQQDNATTLNDHATHVAGTMIASGQAAMAKGMAFGLKKLRAYDFNNNTAEMAEAAPSMLISNHSYGTIAGWRYNTDRKGTSEDPFWEWWGVPAVSDTEDYKFGFYDEATASWDRIAYNAPYFLIVKSGGNNRSETGPAVGQPFMRRNTSGTFEVVAQRPATISSNNSYDGISTYGNAKNILTVGAVSTIRGGYRQVSEVAISAFSSYGPTDDGRIKPDIVGNGVGVLSTTSVTDRSYAALSGTSMSAPNVSGSLLLLQEHYANLNSGQVMRAATLKGLAIHTSDEAGAAPGPDYIYGWGLLNTARAATVISNTNKTHLIAEHSLSQGQKYELNVVASGSGPLVVTISWTDPEGAALSASAENLNNRTPRLVNDLDLRVSGSKGVSLPWILDPENPAAAAKPGDNIRDNVEQIVIPNAVPGETYTIQVAHKGTLSKGPQAYSLLVSGMGGKAYCASAPSSDAGSRISKLTFDGKTQTFAGCATYRHNSETPLVFEPSETKILAFELNTCGASANKIAKVYVDWNGNGSFDDAGETVAVSDVVSGTAVFSASVTAPSSATPGNSTRLRIVLAETTDANAVLPCGTYARGETQDYTLAFTKPKSDIAVLEVRNDNASLCAGTTQRFLVSLLNNGLNAQKNIPVTLKVLKNGVEVAQLSSTYTRTLAPFASDELVVTGSFATEPGTTYEVVSVSTLPNDAITTNNQASGIYAVPGNVAPPQVAGTRCGNDQSYTLTGTGSGGIYWYSSATGNTILAAGNGVRIAAPASGGKLYASLNEFSATVGLSSKSQATTGNYNQFSPSVTVSTRAPVVLESARLYIGNSGKITFYVFDANGAPVSEKTIAVTATRSNPGPGDQPNDPNDQGEVYELGLVLPQAGTYNIGISYDHPNGATIFRNNAGVAGYPYGVPNVFNIIGNTANLSNAYYYFYDLKVSATGCSSPRVEVPLETGTPLPVPVVTREGLSLKSSAADGNQWYFNGQPIENATQQTFTPTYSGHYTVQSQWKGCVSELSQAYTFAYQTDGRSLKKELVVSPNPSNGLYKVHVETEAKENIHMRVTDMLGHEIYSRQVKNFNGFYEANLDLSSKNSGLYLLRVEVGDRVYTQKLVLQR